MKVFQVSLYKYFRSYLSPAGLLDCPVLQKPF